MSFVRASKESSRTVVLDAGGEERQLFSQHNRPVPSRRTRPAPPRRSAVRRPSRPARGMFGFLIRKIFSTKSRPHLLRSRPRISYRSLGPKIEAGRSSLFLEVARRRLKMEGLVLRSEDQRWDYPAHFGHRDRRRGVLRRQGKGFFEDENNSSQLWEGVL